MPALFRNLFVLILVGGTCRATLVPRLTLDEMVDAAECVVEGKVGRSWSSWDPAHQFIWTHYELEVRDWLKGRPASHTLVVSEPGGTSDGLTMHVAGTVPYRTGENVIVFLYRTPVGFLRVLGYGQGKFNISHDARAPNSLVHRDTYPSETAAHSRFSEIEQFREMRLEEFRELVRISVARHAAESAQKSAKK